MSIKLIQPCEGLIEIELDSLDNVFLISDGHWGHKNIIKYTNRPFASIEEMNKYMTEAWNSSVPKDAIIIYLGDFVFYGTIAGKEIKDGLNGVYWVGAKGNHDKSAGHLLRMGFDAVSAERIIIRTDKHVLHCIHRLPQTIPFWTKVKRLLRIGPKVAYIHGHSHNYFPLYRKIGGVPIINVSCENVSYMPMSLERIIRYVEM